MYEKHQKNATATTTTTTTTTTETQSATYGFYLGFIDTFVGKSNGAQARRGVRGPPGPTIIIIKEIIRFKDNSKDRKGPWSHPVPPRSGKGPGPK